MDKQQILDDIKKYIKEDTDKIDNKIRMRKIFKIKKNYIKNKSY